MLGDCAREAFSAWREGFLAHLRRQHLMRQTMSMLSKRLLAVAYRRWSLRAKEAARARLGSGQRRAAAELALANAALEAAVARIAESERRRLAIGGNAVERAATQRALRASLRRWVGVANQQRLLGRAVRRWGGRGVASLFRHWRRVSAATAAAARAASAVSVQAEAARRGHQQLLREMNGASMQLVCPGPPGRLSALSVPYVDRFSMVLFVWARRALNSQKWRFLPRAVAHEALHRRYCRHVVAAAFAHLRQTSRYRRRLRVRILRHHAWGARATLSQGWAAWESMCKRDDGVWGRPRGLYHRHRADDCEDLTISVLDGSFVHTQSDGEGSYS
jgi:hypothetical protein